MSAIDLEFSKKFWGNDTPAEKIAKEESPMNKARKGEDYESIPTSRSDKSVFHIPDGCIRFDKTWVDGQD